MNPSELKTNLNYFSGTEKYYRTSMFNRNIVHTDGVEFLAEKAGAYWLLDAIVSHQSKVRAQSFQTWDLTKQENGTWKLTCGDGNDNTLITQDIEYSDFPLDHIRLFLVGEVILLPSEY